MYKQKSFNKTLSEKTADFINAEPRKCWANAYYALKEVPELGKANYVEGWIIRTAIPIPIEHGWLELDDEIIDPTRVVWEFGYNELDDVLYFAGTHFTLTELKDTVRKVAQ